MQVNPYYQMAKRTIVHKYWVYKFGREIGLSRIQLLLHDISKFHPKEFIPYKEKFFRNNDKYFPKALKHHYKHNKHHPEHWIVDGKPTSMPPDYIKEMYVDWLAAGKVYSNSKITHDSWPWLTDNFKKLKLKNITKIVIIGMLEQYGYDSNKIIPQDWMEING